MARTALTKRELMVVRGAVALTAGIPTLPAFARTPAPNDKPWAKTWDAALATLAARRPAPGPSAWATRRRRHGAHGHDHWSPS